MGVERPATGREVGRRGHAETRRFDHPLRGLVHIALPGVHHTPGEEQDVVAGHLMGSPPERQVAGHPEPSRHESEPSRDGQQRAAEPQQPRATEGGESKALPAGVDQRSLCELLPSRLDQVPVGDAAGAGRFTATALDTRVEGFDDLGGDRGSLVVDLAHEADAAPR